MHERYRGFSDEFCGYMSKRSGWPREKYVYAWFAKQCGGMRKGVYNALKHGSSAAEKHTAGLVDMFLTQIAPDANEYHDIRHAQTVLLDFLRERGVQSLTQLSHPAIVAHICDAVTDRPLKRTARIDYLRLGVSAIGDFVMGKEPVDRYVQRCNPETPQDVQQAIEWMYIRVGQCVGPDGPRLSPERAIAIATEHMQIDLAEYQRRAAAWQRFNPWTVVFGREKGLRLGTSIVLPITEHAYQRINNGRCATYDVTPDDLLSPSTTVLIEGCAEKPDPLGPRDPNPTKSLLMCLAMQLAALSQSRELPKGSSVRFVSFGGTPRNRDRLLDSGFKATGRTMARTGVELFERQIPLGGLRPDTFLSGSLLLYFSGLCDGPPPA